MCVLLTAACWAYALLKVIWKTFFMFLFINTSWERVFIPIFFFENLLTASKAGLFWVVFCVTSFEENYDSVFGIRKFVRAMEKQTRK